MAPLSPFAIPASRRRPDFGGFLGLERTGASHLPFQFPARCLNGFPSASPRDRDAPVFLEESFRSSPPRGSTDAFLRSVREDRGLTDRQDARCLRPRMAYRVPFRSAPAPGG